MLSLEVCKSIVNEGKRKYTNGEIKEIREFLYHLGSLQVEQEENENNNELS